MQINSVTYSLTYIRSAIAKVFVTVVGLTGILLEQILVSLYLLHA